MNTPEQLAHDAGVAMGNALADALEAPILKLADAIAQTRAEQAELRDEVHALANRIEAVARNRTPPLPPASHGGFGRP